jgi:hypothetical protein
MAKCVQLAAKVGVGFTVKALITVGVKPSAYSFRSPATLPIISTSILAWDAATLFSLASFHSYASPSFALIAVKEKGFRSWPMQREGIDGTEPSSDRGRAPRRRQCGPGGGIDRALVGEHSRPLGRRRTILRDSSSFTEPVLCRSGP